ncbi:hypothetical protein EV1_005301 [Malus domestica]
MIFAIDLDCIFAKYYDMLAGELRLTVLPTSSTISILHQVPEGRVWIYWRGGALLKTITDPGFHLKLPLVTHFEPVQVTLQIDQVRDIPCGTKEGVMINFDKIEISGIFERDWWISEKELGGNSLLHCSVLEVVNYMQMVDKLDDETMAIELEPSSEHINLVARKLEMHKSLIASYRIAREGHLHFVQNQTSFCTQKH